MAGKNTTPEAYEVTAPKHSAGDPKKAAMSKDPAKKRLVQGVAILTIAGFGLWWLAKKK